MMIFRYFLCYSIFILLAAVHVQSQSMTLYISTEGSDENSGNIDSPLKSLEGARNKIRKLKSENVFTDTIRVIIKPGHYYLSSTLVLKHEDSGRENLPIIYEAEDGAIFSGGMEIGGFQEIPGGLWATFIPETSYWNWSFDQLYINGRRAPIAKSPNNGYYYLKEVTEEVWIQGDGRNPEKAQQIVEVDQTVSKIINAIPGTERQNVVMTVFHHWNITKRHFDKFDYETNKIFTSGQGMKPWNPWKQGKRFILENFKAALDEPGEWFLSAEGMLYYMPRSDESIETSTFFAPVLEQFLRLEGDAARNKFVEHIVFKNIRFQHAADYLSMSGFEPYQAAISIQSAIELNSARHILFDNCEVMHTGGYGLWFKQAVNSCTVKHSHFHDLGAGGIRIGELTIRDEQFLQTHSNIIENNIIQSGGFDYAPGVGVLIGHSADNQIIHNDIGDFRYTGVSVGWRWGYDYSPAKRNKIKHNHIHHIGWGVLSDMSGVYTLGPSEGTEVANNHIHHIYAFDYGGWGLYTDEGSSKILMENNLVHHTKTGGFHQHYGRENTIRNNILAFNEKYQVQATRVENHLSFSFTNNIILYEKGSLYQGPWEKMNVDIDKNLYWKVSGPVEFFGNNLKNWQKNGYDTNAYIADPLFTDATNGDFTFSSSNAHKKIDFIPFDYTQCGVYGSKYWRDKAKLTDQKISLFNELYK